MRRQLSAATLLAASAAPTLAQSSIDPVNKFCWQENAGYLNWRDANSANSGVRDLGTCLSGFAWGENIGWVRIGGTPANGIQFSNATGADAGVNVSAAGALSGFAWGENVGWINFSGGALASPAQPARIEAGRLRGYAWGENIGWINLDDASKFVKLQCAANCDQSTTAPVLNVVDFVCFNNKFAAGDPSANCDRSNTPPVLNVADFICFLNAFAAGCP
ncbi:MAG: GC-type dockerin domain-anchored protein [Phycisphaerales bacterium]